MENLSVSGYRLEITRRRLPGRFERVETADEVLDVLHDPFGRAADRFVQLGAAFLAALPDNEAQRTVEHILNYLVAFVGLAAFVDQRTRRDFRKSGAKIFDVRGFV